MFKYKKKIKSDSTNFDALRESLTVKNDSKRVIVKTAITDEKDTKYNAYTFKEFYSVFDGRDGNEYLADPVNHQIYMGYYGDSGAPSQEEIEQVLNRIATDYDLVRIDASATLGMTGMMTKGNTLLVPTAWVNEEGISLKEWGFNFSNILVFVIEDGDRGRMYFEGMAEIAHWS